MNTLKTKIKELAEGQVALKNQRKTVAIVGERTIPTWKATQLHTINREELRYLYMVLGIMRGKDRLLIDRNADALNEDKLTALITFYTDKVDEVCND